MKVSKAPDAVWSLRNRLLILLVVSTTALWLFVSVSMYAVAQRHSERMFDEALGETARLILAVAQHEITEHGLDSVGELLDTAALADVHNLVFQLWTNDHRLLYRSANAPLQPLSNSQRGYFLIRTNGAEFRALVQWDADQRMQIQIADPLSRRMDIVHQTLYRMIVFGVIFLPATLLFIGWIVERSCAPLEQLSQAVAARSERQLEDVDVQRAPREVLPLITALNVLLARIRTVLQHERRFTADAAHELRTPLAALRAHAQVLQGARSAEEAQEAASDIMLGVDRSRRMIDQLLALARVDQTGALRAAQAPVDLRLLITQQCAQHAAQAAQRGISLETALQPAQVGADAEHLGIMLRNLLDNALRYTPAGGRVRVGCGMDGNQAFMAVHDSGVGIPAAQRDRVFERFYRINRVETAHAFGSGLGLSIVQRLVQQFAAQIDMEDGLDGKGVGFVVRFAASVHGQ